MPLPDGVQIGGEVQTVLPRDDQRNGGAHLPIARFLEPTINLRRIIPRCHAANAILSVIS
jgi:hypothetical protein